MQMSAELSAQKYHWQVKKQDLLNSLDNPFNAGRLARA